MTGAEVIIPTRRILKWPRQTATMTLDELTMGKGHRGRDLSSTPVKQAVSLHLGLAQPQTLVPGQIGTQSPEPASTGQSFYVQVCKWPSLWSARIRCCPASPLHWAVFECASANCALRRSCTECPTLLCFLLYAPVQFVRM